MGAWSWAAYAYALVIGTGLSYFILGIPVQLTDCLANLYAAQQESLWNIVRSGWTSAGYLRPFLTAQIKVMYEVAAGHYFETFKAVHVAQVLIAALLFVRLLRVRGWSDVVVVPFGLALLFGAHTFEGSVNEAFPVNSFLTVIIACLVAVDLALSPPSWWRGYAAILLFVITTLTLETGLLVWVSIAAAWMVGGRGVSSRALAVATLLLAAYVVVRLTVLDTAAPGLMERPSGFGFRALEAQELMVRFGESPSRFYAYNVVCQVMTVLFGEPRGGIWHFIREMLADNLRPGQIIGVATSTGATVIIAWYVLSRLRQWRRREFEHADRVVFVFGAVLVANAVISFPYTKDVIVGASGALHALAAAVALNALLFRMRTWRIPATVAASVFLLALSTGAAVQLVGMGYVLRESSFRTRNDWTAVDDWARRNSIDYRKDPAQAQLAQQLRDDALARRTPAPHFAQPRLWRYFR